MWVAARLPTWLVWPILSILYIIGVIIGSILQDIYSGTYLTWKNRRR
jgi:hypothetical protein